MTLAPPSRTLAPPELPPVRLTVDQYHRMIEQHILEEDTAIELLDGVLVRKDRAAMGGDPMTIGGHHAYIVNKLAALARQLPEGAFIQTQQPIALPVFDEPEPDGALVLGGPADYRDRKPRASDILAVFEVADSSLQRDRTTKLRIYAKAAIPLYILINLPERCVEVYTQPLPRAARYGHTETLTPKQSLTLALPKRKSLKLSIASLLP